MLDLTNRKSPEELGKLPSPTNDNLKLLFADIDTIIIKENGVSNGKAMSDKILLTIEDKKNVKQFADLLEIDEMNAGFYCMCLGTYAIEVFSNGVLKAAIGFHHGVSIRYDLWNSDAALAQSDNLLMFLSELGFTQPLHDRQEEKRRSRADQVAAHEWQLIAPKCFKKYWEQINDFDNSYFPALIEDLNNEFPDRSKQIIALLQTFGRTANFWTAYPLYEHLPEQILETFEVAEIINAYLNSDRNYKTRRGLGRFLCSFDFKKARKKYLKDIPVEVIDELEKCFALIGEKRGINEIFKLRNEKNKSV